MLKEEKIKIIADAIGVIDTQESWTDGPLAGYREIHKVKNTKTGKEEILIKLMPVDVNSPKATCWCVIGAILKVSPNDFTVRDEAREFCKKQYGITLADLNDLQGRKKAISVLQEYVKSL